MTNAKRKVIDAASPKELLDAVIKWITDNPKCKVTDVMSMLPNGKPTAVVIYEELK